MDVRRLGYQPGWVRARLWWCGIMTRKPSKSRRMGAAAIVPFGAIGMLPPN